MQLEASIRQFLYLRGMDTQIHGECRLRNCSKSLKFLIRVGIGAAMLFAVNERPLAQVSEIDSYDRAVTSQSKEEALAFIEEFRSSHLIGDLIESLRPEVAREVCADLPNGISRARRACEQLPKVPVTETTTSSKDVAGGSAQSSAATAPMQSINTQTISGMAPAPATTGTVAVAPQVVAPAIGGQSETDAPPTTAASGTSGGATAAADTGPSSSELAQPLAITPPTPIKSMPVVYVRSDSGANILAQARDGSTIIGTASSNAPLTVLGRDRSWLKVLVPGMPDRAGWVHTSRLQTEADGIKVVPATGTTALLVMPSASTSAAPAATGAAEIAPFPSNLPQPATARATPIKSRPVVYVRSNSDADIFAQATDNSAIIGTASRNAPLTALGRDHNWLKVVVPGKPDRTGWVHISRLQMDADAVEVVPPATVTAAPP